MSSFRGAQTPSGRSGFAGAGTVATSSGGGNRLAWRAKLRGPFRSSLAVLIAIFTCPGTHSVTEDPGLAVEEQRLIWLREEARRRIHESLSEPHCLAGTLCADRKEFVGPFACLAGLNICNSRGTVERAVERLGD